MWKNFLHFGRSLIVEGYRPSTGCWCSELEVRVDWLRCRAAFRRGTHARSLAQMFSQARNHRLDIDGLGQIRKTADESAAGADLFLFGGSGQKDDGNFGQRGVFLEM